jgi:hypothetical protein
MRVNLRRTKDRVDANEFALLRFAKKHFYDNEGQKGWDGRQIFNAFQTAIALAEFDQVEKEKESGTTAESGLRIKPKLTEEHFSQVAKTYKKFEDYLQETHGGYNDTLMSKMDGLRADSFGFERPMPLTSKQSKSKPKKTFDSSDLPSTEEDRSEATEESEEEEHVSGEERKKKGKKRREASLDRKGKGKKGGKGKRSKKKSKRDDTSTEAEDDDDS